MKKKAIIWRKSIYESGFRCNDCGTKLFDAKKAKLYEKRVGCPEGQYDELFCMKCENHVAHIKEVEYNGGKTLLGQWNGKDGKYE